MSGPRWLAGDAVRSMATVEGGALVVVSDGGISWLVQEEWTLAQKAARCAAVRPAPHRSPPSTALPPPPLSPLHALPRGRYEAILTARHDRHGMTSGCDAAAFGAVEQSCVRPDEDNNGLWTSLVVVAEYLRHAVTAEPEALTAASRFFSGIVLLNQITGQSQNIGTVNQVDTRIVAFIDARAAFQAAIDNRQAVHVDAIRWRCVIAILRHHVEVKFYHIDRDRVLPRKVLKCVCKRGECVRVRVR